SAFFFFPIFYLLPPANLLQKTRTASEKVRKTYPSAPAHTLLFLRYKNDRGTPSHYEKRVPLSCLSVLLPISSTPVWASIKPVCHLSRYRATAPNRRTATCPFCRMVT